MNTNGLFDPDKIVFRGFLGEVDFPNIVAVTNASLSADKNRERNTVEGLASKYAHPVRWGPQQDILLVEMNDQLIGYADTDWRYEDDRNCLHFINLFLVFEWRGCGIEPAMQRHMERCARAAASADSNVTHWFSSKVPETWPARVEVLRDSGYTAVGSYLEMQRLLLADDVPEAVLPTGLSIRRPSPEHYRAIWEASVECFRDQRDYVAASEEDYQAWVSMPDLDPSLWIVAWDGDQVAGAAINTLHEGDWGETDDLFVRRPWRKRGLGRALLLGSLHLFKERGLTTAGLGVDAENVSGALGMYESAGYRPYQRLTDFRKRLSPMSMGFDDTDYKLILCQ